MPPRMRTSGSVEFGAADSKAGMAAGVVEDAEALGIFILSNARLLLSAGGRMAFSLVGHHNVAKIDLIAN